MTPGTAWCDLKGLLQEAPSMSFLVPQRNDALVGRLPGLTGVGAAVIMIAAHDGPFSGQISVQPAVLLQVMPEATSG